jgi:thiamine pyrophosphokinase
MNITIIANGSFPTLPSVLSCLGEADRVVCCDGALEKYLPWVRRQNPRPVQQVAVVGDGDSLSPALLNEALHEGLPISHQQISEQESNDLSKAVRYAAEHTHHLNEPIYVSILGATGKREDHTLGNIALLAYYSEHYPLMQFAMVGDYGTFYPVNGLRRFPSYPGQQVSLFALRSDITISVKGLKYPIENRCLEWLWQGTLNESLGDSFEVKGERVIVFQKR